jgi:hypothetical protein
LTIPVLERISANAASNQRTASPQSIGHALSIGGDEFAGTVALIAEPTPFVSTAVAVDHDSDAVPVVRAPFTVISAAVGWSITPAPCI